MTSPRLDDDSVEAWFAEFRRQSFDPGALGTLRWYKEMTGGLSDARVALCLCAPDGSAQPEPLVLKWGELDNALQEATTRRSLAEQGGDHQLSQISELESRGASHIAIRTPPGRTGVYGIIASPFAGTLNPENEDRTSNYETFIQEVYVARGAVSEDDLPFYLKETINAIAPSRERPAKKPYGVELPDIADVQEKLAEASRLLDQNGMLPPSIPALREWLHGRLGKIVAYPDSRTIHGDPRFANVVLDRRGNQVTLIDYGEGRPGRHVFRDLARFEVDVLLRSTKPDPARNRSSEVIARAEFLQRTRVPHRRTPRAERVAAHWSQVRDEHVTELIRPEVFTLYSVFILTELFRRTAWHGKGWSVENVGGTLVEIATAIDVIAAAAMTRGARGR